MLRSHALQSPSNPDVYYCTLCASCREFTVSTFYRHLSEEHGHPDLQFYTDDDTSDSEHGRERSPEGSPEPSLDHDATPSGSQLPGSQNERLNTSPSPLPPSPPPAPEPLFDQEPPEDQEEDDEFLTEEQLVLSSAVEPYAHPLWADNTKYVR